MRETILLIHRWLGITVGVIFGIASLTGAILVYEPELDQLLNAGRFPVTPGLLSPADLDLALAAAAGDATVRTIRWPTDRRPVFTVDVREDGRGQQILLDPGTGTVIRPQRSEIRVILGIRRVHTQLFAGRPGRLLLEISCYAALIGLVTGAILWWPGLRRLVNGLMIRWRRGTYIFNYDVHQSLGIVFLPLLFVLTLTGVLIPRAGVSEWLADIVLPASEKPRTFPPVQSSSPAGEAAVSIAHLVLTAQSVAGPGSLESINWPDTGDGVIDVRVRTGPALAAGRITRVLFDRHSGDVLQVRDPAMLDPAVEFARSGVFNLHIGAIGGPLVRAVWFIACVVGFVLLPTGLVVWWMKRTRKAKATEQREALRARHVA